MNGPHDRRPGAAEPPEDIAELAGEYVLGTAGFTQRQAIEQRLRSDESLQQAVARWEERLLPLTAAAGIEEPPPGLWSRIESTLWPNAAAPAATAFGRWWNSLLLWRTLSAGALAALAFLLLATPALRQPASPQYLVVLVAPQDKAPGWIVQVSGGSTLSLTALGGSATAPPQDKALQFWTKADGWPGPVSLGLVRPGGTRVIPLDRLPPVQPNQLFEITLEPRQGSPIGRPTGPIQFIGRAVKAS